MFCIIAFAVLSIMGIFSATNRALASLFAASHGLIGDGVSEP